MIRNHMLHGDAALDLYRKAQINKARKKSDFHGFAIASDESPPEMRKYCGLRFQITNVYEPYFYPVETWRMHSRLPLRVESILTDIVHCPGKTGDVVLLVIDKSNRSAWPDSFRMCLWSGGWRRRE